MFEDYSGESNEGHKHHKNYMFFQHLHTIKDAIEDMLNMDKDEVDSILTDGHNWALDHMATSVDDLEEVYHFLKNRVGVETRSDDDESKMEEPMEMTSVEIMEEPGSAESEMEM